jgi:hypothetical protein
MQLDRSALALGYGAHRARQHGKTPARVRRLDSLDGGPETTAVFHGLRQQVSLRCDRKDLSALSRAPGPQYGQRRALGILQSPASAHAEGVVDR